MAIGFQKTHTFLLSAYGEDPCRVLAVEVQQRLTHWCLLWLGAGRDAALARAADEPYEERAEFTALALHATGRLAARVAAVQAIKVG